MLQLNEQEKEVFLKLARSQDADIIKGYIERVIGEVVNIDNLSTDPIRNAQITKQILKSDLLDHLTEHRVDKQEPENYE